jgi:hypothetical protein
MLYLQTIMHILGNNIPFLNLAFISIVNNKYIANICNIICNFIVFIDDLLSNLYNIMLSKDGFLLLIIIGLFIDDSYYYTNLYLLYTVHSLCHYVEDSNFLSTCPWLKKAVITHLKHIEKGLIVLIILDIFKIILPVFNSFGGYIKNKFSKKKPHKPGGNKPYIIMPLFINPDSDSDSDYEESDYYSKWTYVTQGWVTVNKKPGKSIAIETIYYTNNNNIVKRIVYDVIEQDGKTCMKYKYQIR